MLDGLAGGQRLSGSGRGGPRLGRFTGGVAVGWAKMHPRKTGWAGGGRKVCALKSGVAVVRFSIPRRGRPL